MAKDQSRLRRLFGRDAHRDVDDELSFHLEMRVQELIARGENPERARALALERFGDVDSPRSEMLEITERRSRRMARSEFTDEVKQDVAYALRTLRRTPGFSLVAVLTLALGIGANSAIFSVVYGVLLQSLPYREPAQLMEVQTAYPNGENYPLSAPDFMNIHDDNRVFSEVAAYNPITATVLGLGDPQEIEGAGVTKSYFRLLGTGTQLGRPFDDNDHVPGRNDVLLVSHGFWQQQLGGARDVLGRTLSLAGRPYTIVGVLAKDAPLPATAQLFRPIAHDSTFDARTSVTRRGEWLFVIGRLKPGVTRDAALQDVQRIGKELQAAFTQTNQDLTFTTRPLTEALVGTVRAPLLMLLGAVAFVLLVACANVANLLLARATARESELAVRAALGAGRGRLIRQLLTESVILSLAGAAVGLLLAWWATRTLVARQLVELPRLQEVGINGTVLLFTATVAIGTGLLFGMLPALQATGTRLSLSLREGGRGALSTGRGKRIRSALVVAELAFAVILLVGAGLFIRSFLHLTKVNPGFEPERAVSFRVSLQGERYATPESRIQFYDQLFDNLRGLPGVTVVGAASGLPLTGDAALNDFRVVGAPPPPTGIFPEIRVVRVTPDYFQALGTPLLHGRMLNAQDQTESPRVILINRAAIARWFPDGKPVGKQVVIGSEREIVGLVDNVLQTTPDEAPEPEAYFPYKQSPTRTMRVVVRGNSDMMALAPRIRETLRSMDDQLPLDQVAPLTQLLSASVARPRFFTTLLTLFAGVALTLAVVGIFGVMSYIVTQRTREISVRIALGADARQVVRMVVQSALALAGLGLAIGVGGALALGQTLRAQLFGVGVADPVTIGGVLVVLLSSAALASYLPARRAARVDPGVALREA